MNDTVGVVLEMFAEKSDIVAKGVLSILGERVNVEMTVTQMCAGDFNGGSLSYDSGEYNGSIMTDFMGNMSATLRKGNEVIFRKRDNHWLNFGDSLDNVPLECRIPNPAIWRIVNYYSSFFYSTLAYTENYSKLCPRVRWKIYDICNDGIVTVKWTVTNLSRTANDDGYECDATAYYATGERIIEQEDGEPVYHLVTYDEDCIKDTKVFYNGEQVLNIEGVVFDRLCEEFLNYIDLCNLGYGEY